MVAFLGERDRNQTSNEINADDDVPPFLLVQAKITSKVRNEAKEMRNGAFKCTGRLLQQINAAAQMSEVDRESS